jgi:DNA-binding NarL/FixJ family response regulator
MAKPRVILADDHVMLLGAFAKLLAGECDIVGQVADGRALVAEAMRLRPDVILLDVAMPLLNGLEAGYQIKQTLPDVRLVYVTVNESTDIAAEAFRIGGSAYLLKRSAASELTTAIREVMEGRSYVTPLLTQGLIGSLLPDDARPAQGAQRGNGWSCELTHRQREVLQLMAEGHTMKEVAGLLNLAPRTVAFHKNRMKEQLHVKSTAALIEYAVKHHIV